MELQVGEFAFAGSRYFTGFVRDLTERQEAERRIQDLQAELLHASRLSVMGQMASTMAHELNQPLTAVMNYLEAGRQLIATGMGGPERVSEMMEKAIAQAQRAGEVIRQLRGFVSKGETERRIQNLNQLVEEALALALVGARQRGVRASLELDHSLPPVFVDHVQIQQVVLNLVRNAVEAMEEVERRELTIGTRAIPEQGMAEVIVADTGPGIAPELADRLFQPFVTTKATGMGLGLSICREIVEAHDGRLSAAPGPSGGTVFRVTLPIARPEEAVDASERRVYIVDDDEAVRDSLSVMLEARTYAVKSFGSAPEFLAAAPSLPLGCLIVDIRMPEMDGLELQQSSDGTRTVDFPLIVITGHGDVPLAVRAMKAGAVDFIEKPFTSEAILNSLDLALSRLAVPSEQDPTAMAAVAKLVLLSPREREVLEGLLAGLPNKTIAYDLAISPRTVEIHRARVMDKMGARSLSELVRLALAAGVQPSRQ